MLTGSKPSYYLVAADTLPEVFLKVSKAKELLETGDAKTVAEAVAAVGISRSAFYKYKDKITPFVDLKSGRIMTFNMTLRNKPGVLSSVLSIFASSGANILMINQSIPISGCAAVTISAEISGMNGTPEELMQRLRGLEGLRKVEVLAG
ncbi:MAG TPA: ACT domain-containing protein [Clostridiales bacterium]|jgi:chorismate mutase|nr:ACT domain-containing protein [Clostridiales bacterium]